MALAHNLRNMRKYLPKMDATIKPRIANETELKQKFQMVCVRIEPRLPALQPKYAGPALVLEVRGKVITIKWLNNGFIERVSADCVKPVH